MSERIPQSMTVFRVGEILGGVVIGDGTRSLTGFKTLELASPEDLSFLHRKRYLSAAENSKAGAIIVNADVQLSERTLIVVPDASAAYRQAIELFYPAMKIAASISPKSLIEEDVEIGEGVYIGPGAIVGRGTRIGMGTVIMAGAIIGEDCVIGPNSAIHSGAVLYPGVVLGQRVVIHACAVLGAEGFGFHRLKDGTLAPVRQVGTVVIEDDVQIGACSCVDRAALARTRVGSGTKVDSHVIIGHNVEVGQNCLIIGQSGIAGSTTLGDRVSLYGQTGVTGHVKVGDDTTLLARGCITRDTARGSRVAGFPAIPAKTWKLITVLMNRLPELYEEIRTKLRNDASSVE